MNLAGIAHEARTFSDWYLGRLSNKQGGCQRATLQRETPPILSPTLQF